MNDSLKIAGGLMFLTAILAIVAAMVWPGKEPVNQIVPCNTFRFLHPAQFWDEGEVYVTVHYWRSNDTWAVHFQPTNNWDEIIAWLQARSRGTGFFIIPTNIPEVITRFPYGHD